MLNASMFFLFFSTLFIYAQVFDAFNRYRAFNRKKPNFREIFFFIKGGSGFYIFIFLASIFIVSLLIFSYHIFILNYEINISKSDANSIWFLGFILIAYGVYYFKQN